MNCSAIINGILDHEGPGKPPYLAPGDSGGRTAWGISERSHPEAWRPGPPSRDQARAIYMRVYVMPFIKLEAVAGDRLIAALVDDAVMSGVNAAIRRLQVVLNILPDGVIGPRTMEALRVQKPAYLLQRYVIERVVRITRLVEDRPKDLVNLTGWVTRILSFLLPEV